MNDLSYKLKANTFDPRTPFTPRISLSTCCNPSTVFYICFYIYFLARHYNPIYIHRFKTCVNICADREQYKPSQFSKRNLALFLIWRPARWQPWWVPTKMSYLLSMNRLISWESVESVWNRSRLASLSRVTTVQLGFYLKNGRCVNQAKIGSVLSDSGSDWVCRPFQTDLTEFADHGSWHI